MTDPNPYPEAPSEPTVTDVEAAEAEAVAFAEAQAQADQAAEPEPSEVTTTVDPEAQPVANQDEGEDDKNQPVPSEDPLIGLDPRNPDVAAEQGAIVYDVQSGDPYPEEGADVFVNPPVSDPNRMDPPNGETPGTPPGPGDIDFQRQPGDAADNVDESLTVLDDEEPILEPEPVDGNDPVVPQDLSGLAPGDYVVHQDSAENILGVYKADEPYGFERTDGDSVTNVTID